MRFRAVARWTSAASTFIVLGTAPAAAQDITLPHERPTLIGARYGYEFESEQRIISAMLTVPMNSRVDFYPSVDIYTPEKGSRIGINGDLKISFRNRFRFFYAGLGAGVISNTVGDSSHTEWGANLLLGGEAHFGWFRPFVEGRAVSRDKTQLQLIGGINISRGP